MADEIMALTVRPPWSVAIAAAWKTRENRSWATPHRGLLAIHSGTTLAAEAFGFPPLAALWTPGTPLHRGSVIAVVTLEGCHPAAECEARNGPGTCSPWAMPGYDWHWVLTGAVALPEPVPCEGQRRLWPLPEDAGKAVRAQMEEASRDQS